ncbi:MAG: ABC transporter substrate-binding protein [Rhodoferax sp.]|nr:ABC transporter substrate-binding protein [Rhodoferax sp.]
MKFGNLFAAKRRAIAWLMLGFFLGGAHAAETGVSDTEIVLGMDLALQGGKNNYGVAAAQGMKLYFDGVNASGGINGRKIVQRILDDDNKAANAEANARKLVQDGAFILFSAIDGGPSTAVMKVASELKVPFFGPMAGPPILRRPHQPLVFPVRAEHKDEFRALMAWGKNTGIKTVGFLHADTEVGRTHLENVRLAAKDLGMEVSMAIPFKGDETDAQVGVMAKAIADKQPGMFINHGSAGFYTKLITTAKKAGARTTFMAVNSGSSQIAKGLGPLAYGMVFSQVVPSPWERKREIAREYQDAARKASPNPEFNYGALEGYMTAKVLAMALRSIPPKELSRASLVKALYSGPFDVGGLVVRFEPGNHEGSHFVDLSIVSREGRFIH